MSISEEEQQVKGCLSVFVAPADVVMTVLLVALKGVALSYAYTTLVQPVHTSLPLVPWTAFSGFLLIRALMRYKYNETIVKQEEEKSVRDWLSSIIAKRFVELIAIGIVFVSVYLINWLS